MVTLSAADTTRDRLGLALLAAAALHALVIFGVTFQALAARNETKPMEVTLVQAVSSRPVSATHIAQADQLASGNRGEREQAARAAPSLAPPLPAPRDQQASRAGSAPQAAVEETVSASRNSRYRVQQSDNTAGDAEPSPSQDRLQQLQERLAALEASLHNREEASSSAPRVRRLTSVAAQSTADAAYLQDWRRRLEAVGNTYYPEASVRYGMYGSLRLLVTIRSDGSLEDVELLASSGYAVLDEAAIRIVRMAAPYAPFPAELRATADKLEILRTWKFERNALSSG
ncbi:MAG: TonB family protein [Chromatocurvus sp.]